ncbi:MAG TPA: TadE/TadG family type IV pilus assembly protein [Candidatus Baltobacteraceae bacterium]|nr:TadE/TadG family type IV pilus assembly protein [Candidatus Baltobacteraceae bacterium]
MRRLSSSQAGVALVEFAIALPFLLIVMMGIVEMGRLAYYNILVGNAAYAGAFYGSSNLRTAADTSGMTAAAIKDGQNVPQISVSAPTSFCECYNSSTGSASSLSCSLNGSTCSSGTHRIMYVQVTVSGRINTLFNYRPLGLPNPWTITRTATIRVSNTTG